MAVDPGRLLGLDATSAAGKKALLAAILASMPVSFTPDELPEAARGLASGASSLGLADLVKIRKGIEETRRRIGVEVRDADGAIRDLRKSLPDEGEVIDWPAELQRLSGELSAHERTLADKIAGIRADAQAEKDGLVNYFASRETEIRERFRVELESLAENRHKEVGEVDASLQAAILDVQTEARGGHDRLTAELATAKEKAAQSERVAGARETISNLEQKWAAKSDDYDRLTAVIEKLDAARKAKLESLPVSGLEFDGENVLVDGVEWQNVNTARRVSVSLQLCGLRAGELPFLILDDSEHLDAEMWQQIRAAAVDGGFQLVAARVSDRGPLKIETNEEQA
jgi:HPt (histidine-containing phosphotransfer) domain-containing protein